MAPQYLLPTKEGGKLSMRYRFGLDGRIGQIYESSYVDMCIYGYTFQEEHILIFKTNKNYRSRLRIPLYTLYQSQFTSHIFFFSYKIIKI